MTRPRRNARRGYSLIEMVLVVGGVAVVLGLCGTVLHALLRLDRAGRAALDDSATLARLARQFRRDVRAASTATPVAKRRETLDLSGDGVPTVSYRVAAGRLLREERDGGSVRRRESYDVTRLGPVRFEADGRLVRLVLPRRPADPRAFARPAAAVAVEAGLGKDRAAAGTTETQP